MKILFVTWDGPQVAYLEALFLPIFAALKRRGYEFSILQFTWGDNHAARDASESYGVPYRRVEVLRAGAAGAFVTAFRGGKYIDQAHRECKFDALMPRSLLPALAVMRSKSSNDLPLIFDSDGLAADEKVEFAGLNPLGIVYRVLRWVEARTVRSADKVLVRTEEAIGLLKRRADLEDEPNKFAVVTNGREPAPFLKARRTRRSKNAPRLCYVGSLGPQYLPSRMLELAAQIRSFYPETDFTIVTRHLDAAQALINSSNFQSHDWITVRTAEAESIPSILTDFDVGFALREATLSMSAVAPIKVAEYLLAGLPIIGSEVVGPVQGAVESGCMLSDKSTPEQMKLWLHHLLSKREEVGRKCQSLGIRDFSIDRSVEQLDAVLSDIKHSRVSDRKQIWPIS